MSEVIGQQIVSKEKLSAGIGVNLMESVACLLCCNNSVRIGRTQVSLASRGMKVRLLADRLSVQEAVFLCNMQPWLIPCVSGSMHLYLFSPFLFHCLHGAKVPKNLFFYANCKQFDSMTTSFCTGLRFYIGHTPEAHACIMWMFCPLMPQVWYRPAVFGVAGSTGDHALCL